MINSMTHTPTIVIKYNNEQLLVNSLPENIINEVATLDRLTQDRLDAFYKLEVYNLASDAKIIQINKMLNDHFAPKEVNDESIITDASK